MKGPLDTMYTISAFYMMTQWHFAYGLQGSINEPTHLGYVSQMMVSFLGKRAGYSECVAIFMIEINFIKIWLGYLICIFKMCN